MLRLLIADTERLTREGLVVLIKKTQFDIVTSSAQNGKEALSIIEREHIDILVTDIKIPFLNGLELARIAKSLNPEIMIILISADCEFEFAKQAIQIGVASYILKPVNQKEFIQCVSRCIENLKKAHRPAIQQDIWEIQTSKPFINLDKNDYIVHKVKSIIENELSQNINVNYIADKLNLTPNYLGKIFKRATSKTINQCIVEKRISLAVHLLKTTNLKIVDIAKICSYSNPSYFVQQFKRTLGISPGEFRVKWVKTHIGCGNWASGD